MATLLALEQGFSAPMEHVGGAIERALRELPGWRLGHVDRPKGKVMARLRAGPVPWVDKVILDLTDDGPGKTRLGVRLERSVPWSRRAPREARLGALLARIGEILGEGDR